MSGLRPTEMTIRRLLLKELEKRGVKVNPEISFMTPVGRITPDAVLQNSAEAKLDMMRFYDYGEYRKIHRYGENKLSRRG